MPQKYVRNQCCDSFVDKRCCFKNKPLKFSLTLIISGILLSNLTKDDYCLTNRKRKYLGNENKTSFGISYSFVYSIVANLSNSLAVFRIGHSRPGIDDNQYHFCYTKYLIRP